MPRAIFQLPDSPARLVLSGPVREVTARTADEIPEAVQAIREASAQGLTAAGFIAYEAAPAFEPRMRVRTGNRMPLLWFGLFERADVDRATAAGAATPELARDLEPLEWRVNPGPAAHAEAVAAIRAHIADGRTYQVNLTARLRAPFDGDPLALWDAMCRAQGHGCHAYLDLGRFVIASASPELFFAIRARAISARPMKGTRPRGRWREEDVALRQQLHGSAKDRAENLMIVDLLRNDIGRVAEAGSVRVPRLFDVERYRTVWQMTSTITATLRQDVGLFEVLEALFPCGSVTGAPKISTMGIIADLEESPREVYCGAIGLIRPGGEATFSVPIRTVWIDREEGRAEYGAGGGVVWDSDPDAEYDELLAKTAVIRAPWPPFRLLETLRLEDGALVRADRHLARLRSSADHFGFPMSDDEVRSTLDAICRGHPVGRHRVRLLLAEDGSAHGESEPLEPLPSEPRPVVFAASPVSSEDPFLYHKTTRRDVYRQARVQSPDAWDVLLVNQRGDLTEFTRGNLVVDRNGDLLTPPLDAGLLPGCLRAELLEEGTIREAVLRPPDLESASRLWFINSLRGWVEVVF